MNARILAIAVLAGCTGASDDAPELFPVVGCSGSHSDPELEYAYVVNRGDDTVTVVNPRSCTVATTVDVGHEPIMANASASGAFVFVGNHGDGSLTLIETDRHAVVKTVDLGFAPEEMKFDAAHVHLWVANRTTGQVALFDTISQTITAELQLEPGLGELSMSSGEPDWMVANNPDGGFLQVIDPASVTEVARVDTEGPPLAVDYASASHNSYVCVGGSDPALLVVPTEGAGAHVVRSRIPLDAPCTTVRFDHGRYGVAAVPDRNEVLILDSATDTIVATVPVGNRPDAVTLNGDVAAIGNLGSGDVSVVSLETFEEVARPTIGSPSDNVLSRELRDAMDVNFVYAVSPDDDTVSILDLRTGEVRGTVEVGPDPGPIIVAGKAGGSCC